MLVVWIVLAAVLMEQSDAPYFCRLACMKQLMRFTKSLFLFMKLIEMPRSYLLFMANSRRHSARLFTR